MGIYAVTGAASGIGQAAKERLESDGHEVIAVDLSGAQIEGDLSDASQRQGVVAQILELAPDGLDGLIPCAGVGPEVPRKELVPLVNFFAVVDMVEALLPALEKKSGAVVLICSNSAQLMPYDDDYIQALLTGDSDQACTLAADLEGHVLYGGGKQALGRWMRQNNGRFAGAGVRVNAIAPGYTETGMTASGRDDPQYGDSIRQFVESIPIGRAGQPEDQANAISFLLSEQAGFISGSVLFVDGGHDAMFRPQSF